MEQYKQEFISFMAESEVLKFGEFTLKSGRKSPFFMNAGLYITGSQLFKLGKYYAQAIHEHLVMILMYCSDLHIRVFRLVLQLLLHTMNFMAKIYVIVLTVKRQRIMGRKESCLEAALKMVTG